MARSANRRSGSLSSSNGGYRLGCSAQDSLLPAQREQEAVTHPVFYPWWMAQ